MRQMILKRHDAFRAVCEFRTEVNQGTLSVGTGKLVSSQADENAMGKNSTSG